MRLVIIALITLTGSLWLPLAELSAQQHPAVKAGLGIMVGGVSTNVAHVQVRLSSTDKLVPSKLKGVSGDVPGVAGVVEFSLQPADAQVQLVKATATHDYIARATFRGLRPGTQYRFQTRIGATRDTLVAGPTATFKTLAGKTGTETARFVVVTGMNYAKFHGDDRIDRKIHLEQNNTELPAPYAGADKHLGYPALASILKLKPDFFVGTGDNVYYDTPKEPRAQTVAELRQKWHEQFVQPRYRDLFASVPTYWMIDDHDYRKDDCDNSGDYEPSPPLALRMMLEQLPYGAQGDDDTRTYYTHRVNQDLQLWFTENRVYRSPNAMEDGPNKTIWGKEQRAWLKRTLQESDAKFKLLVSPTPMIGPDDARKFDNHTNFNGFRHERDEFFKWVNESNLDRFYLVCGDRHWQYHSVHPSGMEEFSCGALVDANSRLGRAPGDPQSTDPKGRIRQRYAQKTRSAGFLLVTIHRSDNNEARLSFQWYDEFGKLLHTHVKQ